MYNVTLCHITNLVLEGKTGNSRIQSNSFSLQNTAGMCHVFSSKLTRKHNQLHNYTYIT